MQQLRTNRDKLLDGALACLRERGYGNTSSRDIARAAGVNVASINYHFGSKDALLDDALARCFSTWNQLIQEAFDRSAACSPYEQMRAVLEATVDSFEQIRPAVYACIESYAPRCAQRFCGNALLPDMPTCGNVRSTWPTLPLPAPTCNHRKACRRSFQC